jgi:MFS family permease
VLPCSLEKGVNPRAARISVSAVFLIHGIGIANWLARIPSIQAKLGLSVGILGLALLGMAAGCFVSMPLVAKLVGRYGSARATRWTSLAFCAALTLPAFAVSATSLGALLFIFGLTAGAMDVAMNTQAVDVETAYRRPVMVSFHALFSVGGMIGSGMGGMAAAARIDPFIHLSMAGLLLAVAAVFATGRLLSDLPGARLERSRARVALTPLLGLAVIAFCVLVGEGAMADWTAVYLSRLTGPGTAAAGYASFSLAMAGGRFAGDWLRGGLGSVALVRWGGLIAAAGLGAGLLSGSVNGALIGFACAGAGFSTIFPIACSAAGRKAGVNAQAGIATVTAFGYLGFVTGPPVIGLLAQMSSLRMALGFVVLLSAIAALLANGARE